MRVHRFAWLVPVFGAICTCATAQTPSLTITAGSNPLVLVVNQSAEIRVLLGDLGQLQLDSLGGTVEFDATHLGTPELAIAGSIVPVTDDLILTPLPGSIDAQFFASIPAARLVNDGEFFRFTLTGVAEGSGVIRFEPLSTFAEDADGNPLFELPTIQLSYQVVIPEPTALVGVVTASMLLLRRR